jgi:predicted enzyme related to lactoylglutathione lyase
MSSPVVQWQMVVKNPDEITKFYRALFGWNVTTQNSLGYRQVDTGEGGLRGGVWPAPPDAQSMVQLFVAVPNVEDAAEKALGLGAKIIVPPTTLPDGDTMAVLLDPAGLTFGIVRHT